MGMVLQDVGQVYETNSVQVSNASLEAPSPSSIIGLRFSPSSAKSRCRRNTFRLRERPGTGRGHCIAKEVESSRKEQMRRANREYVMEVARGEARCRYIDAKLTCTTPSRTAATYYYLGECRR